MQWILTVGEALVDLTPEREGGRQGEGSGEGQGPEESPVGAGARPGDSGAPRPTAEAGALTFYRAHAGGAPANVAVAVARLGGHARFWGKLSSDGFGRMLRAVMEQNGVDMRYAPIAAAPTTLALVTLDQGGDPRFRFCRSGTADTLLTPEELDPAVWEQVAVCHAGSVSLSVEPSRRATLVALQEARNRGCTTSFDVNARPELWPSTEALASQLANVLPMVTLLKFNAEEAPLLSQALEMLMGHRTYREVLDHPSPAHGSGTLGQEDRVPRRAATGARAPSIDKLLELALALLRGGPELVVVTLGAGGALLATARHQLHVPAIQVDAVDTTGAGDAFTGALLHQLVQRGRSSDLAACSSEELSFMGQVANHAAALSCTRHGGIPSLPFREELGL